MKKISVLTAFFCLVLMAGAACAQEMGDNFSGKWELNTGKSNLPERMRIESMTMIVTQSDQEIKVETSVKRAARGEGENRRDGDGSGGMRQGGMAGGNGTMIYSLVEGARKGTVIKPENALQNPPPAAKRAAALRKDGKLNLNSSRTTSTQMGEFTITTEETWEILDGGRELKVTRKTETPRGLQTSELDFTKSGSSESSNGQATGVSDSQTAATSENSTSASGQTPKMISGGVLNGKAVKLALPVYPAEARETRAGGGVNVQVTIDEDGKVVSAKAISGDSALRSASEEAALNSVFTPTRLNGVPVKVTGIIYYNFVP